MPTPEYVQCLVGKQICRNALCIGTPNNPECFRRLNDQVIIIYTLINPFRIKELQQQLNSTPVGKLFSTFVAYVNSYDQKQLRDFLQRLMMDHEYLKIPFERRPIYNELVVAGLIKKITEMQGDS